MEITPHSKLFDVLEAYPALEAQIVNIAPPFRNLKNPVLRRTVGRLATLEKVAQVGGMDVDRLVNTLRRAVGQAELASEPAAGLSVAVPQDAGILRDADIPAWAAGRPQFTIDGTALLRRSEVPLGRVNELLGQLAPGGTILLVTDFAPTPILDAMQIQHRETFQTVNPVDPAQHLTFIR